MLSFDQLAEDVTDQLADLDTRIANMRASVERVRALYAEATDIDRSCDLEAELTRRETDLEVLLATQQALEDRVAMSTLDASIVDGGRPDALDDDDRAGIVDAAGCGWGAFVGGLFAIVFVLAAIAPFVLAALVARRAGPAGSTSSCGAAPTSPRRRRSASRHAEHAPASRPG